MPGVNKSSVHFECWSIISYDVHKPPSIGNITPCIMDALSLSRNMMESTISRTSGNNNVSSNIEYLEQE